MFPTSLCMNRPWILTVICRAVQLRVEGGQHDETVRFLVDKGTVDMRRKHGAMSHFKSISSTATAPTNQSASLLTASIRSEQLAKSLIVPSPSGDAGVPPKSGPGDTGYGGLFSKRSRSSSPTVLDYVERPSGPVHKRQKGETKDLWENMDDDSPAVLQVPPHPGTRGSSGASYNVDRDPVNTGQTGSAEPVAGYPPTNASPDRNAPGHGASVTNTATTAAPLANILNDENTGSGVARTTSSRDGVTPVGVGHDRNPAQSGPEYPSIVSNQAYYPSQAAHGVCVAAAAHSSDNDLQLTPVDSAVGNGPVVNEPVATHSSGMLPSVNPAFTALDDETQQPPFHIDQGTSTGPIQNTQPAYGDFPTTNGLVVPDTHVAGQGLGRVPPVSHGLDIDGNYGGIEHPLSPAGNLISTRSSGVGSPIGGQGFQQPDGIPSVSASSVPSLPAPTADPSSHQPAVMPPPYHATAAVPANQGLHQQGGAHPNTTSTLMPNSQDQQPLCVTVLSDPDVIAHAIMEDEYPAPSVRQEHQIRPDQVQLVIAAVAQHLGIPLPGMGPLEVVPPGVPADLMSVSLSMQAPLDGASEPFSAFETAFLRAIIPSPVVASMANTPDPPHEALAVTGNRDFSGAD